MTARDLLWWSARQLEAMETSLRRAWDVWQLNWLGPCRPATEGRASCINAHELVGGPHAWSPLAARAGGWIADLEGCTAVIASCLTGQPAPAGSAAHALVMQARDAVQDTLACAAGLTTEGTAMPGAELFESWSGAIAVRLPLGACHVLALLDGDCARRLAGPGSCGVPLSPLVGVQMAAMRTRPRLTVELAECEIELGELEGLAVGDVLRLGHTLDRPLDVRLDGVAVCAANLGRRGIAKAVALRRPALH